ncbi:MAG: hypothetical protein ACRDK3_06565 [Actinomycetota bacterium]
MSERLPDDVYQRIGDEIGDLLQQAHDWAAKTRSEAESEAARVAEEAAAAAARVVDEAERYAEQVRTEAEKNSQRLRSEAASNAEQVRSAAESEAQRALAEAESRLSDLGEVESEARQRIDSLKQRLLTIAGQLDEEGSAPSKGMEQDELPEKGEDAGGERREASDDLRVETDQEDEVEPVGADAERLATGGTRS